MNKVLRHEDINPDNVTSLGKAVIEFVNANEFGIMKGKGVLNIPADVPSTKNYCVEIFMENIDGSSYIYAGDSEGNLYEHLNGYAGLWIKTERN